jgi:dynein heavy chain
MIASWVQQLDPTLVGGEAGKEALGLLFATYAGETLNWLKRNVVGLVPVADISMVQMLLNLLTGILREHAAIIKKGQQQDLGEEKKGAGDGSAPNAADVNIWLEPMFVYCSVWAFGSCLSVKDGEDYRKQFNDYWRSTHNKGHAKIPSRDTVFDYFLDMSPDGGIRFDGWKNSEYFFNVPFNSSKMAMSSITVPTTETASVTYWMDMLVTMGKPCMLVGYAGCGKTQQINGAIGRLDPTSKICSTINMNFFTDAELLQGTLEGKLEKKTGTNYGPTGNAGLIYFLDDLNLPEVDAYNTQSAIALVRQHLDYGHWYDRQKLALKNIMNCQYIVSMNHTVGSFTVNPRLQRHFATFAVGLPIPTSLLTIYTTFLEGHLRGTGQTDLIALVPNLLKGSMALHNNVSANFRKTAKNFHYEFNLRHLSNLFEGLLNSQHLAFQGDSTKMVALWLHEAERVYGDRLVDATDLAKYRNLAAQAAKKHFPSANMSRFFAAENPDPLVFCHYAESVDEMLYNQVTDLTVLTETTVNALNEYNEVNAVMNLVLFEDAVKHVARISRIILNPAGHALLVGVGGSGKRSLCRLAAFICSYTVVQIQISSSYGLMDLKADLQDMYKKAGTKSEGLVFLFTDQQITNPRFLVYMNDLLASGNIPDLFPLEDMDEIINKVTPKVKAAGIVPGRVTCWDYFIGEVRKNLHVCLCFSPVSDDFRVRCTRFPALVNCTVIDWFQPWPVDALYKVGIQFLDGTDLGDDVTTNAVRQFMPFSFDSVNQVAVTFRSKEGREAYTTPKSYLSLLQLFTRFLGEKRASSALAIERLSDGLQKLRDTASTVGALEEEVTIALASAEVKKASAEEIAEVVGKEKAIVDTETSKANVEATKCGVIQVEVTSIAESAQADLDAAEPLVLKAMAALDTLTKKDLGECKTMSQPPKGVDDVFVAVMILLAGTDPNIVTSKAGKVKDRTWDAAKKQMMTNVAGFLTNLQNFKQVVDEFKVPAINWKDVRPYLALEHFDVAIIEKKNKAAGGLVSWVQNIVIYYDTIVGVEPKRQALRAANERLEAATVKLDKVNKQVAELQAKLDKLTVAFDAANVEKQSAIAEVARMQLKLSLAQRLISALASENDRWAENIEKMTASQKLLVGDVLLATAFISYVGPFTKPYRNELMQKHWVPFFATGKAGRGGPKAVAVPVPVPAAQGDDGEETKSNSAIPTSSPPDPIKSLTTEAEMARWNSQGLPSDQVSMENGTIVANSTRWPLMIDPQLQGVAWVKAKEASRQLAIVRLGQKTLMNKLEFAMENGTSLLIENMGESIDAALNPVIARQTVKKGSRLYIALGDKEVELNPDFRLFLHTKLSNPHYPPEVQAETTLVNFTVTEQGLEDQLLALVMRKERADLAEQRATLIEQDNEFKIKMVELEDQILFKLATAEGEITEDVELIEGLEDAKRISNEISVKMVEAAKTTEMIETTSEKYRAVATRGSLLFFVMKELFRVHTYYMYSLNAFVVVFLRGIDLVSGGNDDGGGAKKIKRKESSLLSKFKTAAKKVVETARFNWNKDMLSNARRRTGEDIGPMVDQLQAAGRMDLSDGEIDDRCGVLCDSILSVVFNYVRRGLFEQDKLTVATLLTLRIDMRSGELSSEEVDGLILAAPHAEPGGMGALAEWLGEPIWAKVKNLELLKGSFAKLGDDMQTDSDDWQAWFDRETPEEAPMPGEYRNLTAFQRLLVLRILRPDRLPAALFEYISDSLGDEYVNQSPFNMATTFEESSPSTPIFFTLFPGVDPTTWVEQFGSTVGMTAEADRFMNISMGQGQDGPAQAAIEKYSKNGGWLMLQNVHLMQAWLPSLERQLESCAETAHPDFRCFISGEAPSLSYLKWIPESLMQSCIKVMNEAPADLKSNLRRGWSNFSEDRIQGSRKPREFKACLFTLCFFHAIVLGRRKFGQQGWSRKYSFNTGDLLICANVCESYINNNADVPWDDLRYIFGEIMYGGHITDPWDRRTNSTYLQVLLQEGIFKKEDLVPCRRGLVDKKGAAIPPLFPSPEPREMDFNGYSDFIEENMPPEAPGLFGLHPNAEIGYLTSYTEMICFTVIVLSGGGGGSSGGDESGGGSTGVRRTLASLAGQIPERFKLLALNDKAEPLLSTTEAPYVLVALQEFERMNVLLAFMVKTLSELEKGLNGQLNMSAAMDDLLAALTINQVPGRNPFHKTSWEKLAWWSKKSLLTWFSDMLLRVAQMQEWSTELELPLSLWYPGLFNPMSFNTAIMQVSLIKAKV